MKEVKKRGIGKIKNCLSIRQMYIYYKSLYDKEDIVDYKIFARIIKKCNKELINQIVNYSEKVTLPYRLGDLQICKFKRSFNQPKNKWKIDYKKTKELGFTVYHDQEYIYKWCWKKHYAIVKNKTGYKFSANRGTARAVPRALERKIDYFK